MTATAEKKFMSAAEYEERGPAILDRLGRLKFCAEAIIPDYPIGRRERGQCKLGAEFVKGKGFRTLRQTTDRHGHWCAPKKSTYSPWPIIVVFDEGADREVQYRGRSPRALRRLGRLVQAERRGCRLGAKQAERDPQGGR
jgi:hypothetical protein